MPLTIVIADDAREYRSMVRFLLTGAPETMTIVGEADDGLKALALVLRERPDILITDMVMPFFNGVELMRRIKEELPETKVILMTSYPEDTFKRLALVSGADAFVNKAVLARDLLPTIREVIP